MSRFDALDAQIIKTISDGRRPTRCLRCHNEARTALPEARCAYRTIDKRLQALRKSGKIRYCRNANNKHAWEIQA